MAASISALGIQSLTAGAQRYGVCLLLSHPIRLLPALIRRLPSCMSQLKGFSDVTPPAE